MGQGRDEAPAHRGHTRATGRIDYLLWHEWKSA